MIQRVMQMLMLTVSILVAGYSNAQDLSSVSVNDQWDKPVTIDSQIKWLVFSHHKEGGEWVKNAIQQQNVSNLSAHNIVYLADISAMPGFITRLFALPKMRDYGFRIGLIRDEDIAQNWPKQENSVSVYWMDNGSVTESQFFASEDTFSAWLKSVR
ncbi:hypothetical protein [Oceanospirillum sediminis]|uniref:FAD/FMN-containing dehydrogenase n=1 Tax=Oceanospirillum sediminis TaxID=2760088 RepID=A0A839IY80_9GAMM|nr:hypothetical protein [Oceanospirillum sediminis]MBB1489640.1 hypothetical protein [Oceanospirillum sediminis]